MTVSLGLWIGFNAVVLGLLALDLGIFHRKPRPVTMREAAGWSAVWVTLALAFAGWVWSTWGKGPAVEFLTGYLIEKSLSVDNIFVFVMLFGYFAVPAAHQHRILFWGILGALVMRGIFIAAGTYLLGAFHWVLYLFGAILILTGLKMLRRPAAPALEENVVLRWIRRLLPITDQYHGQQFWIRQGTKWLATPLLLVLVMVEVTDLLFAIDSIPAIFAVTREPFLVYTSNVFAILGLRSMYFLLAKVVHRIVYLNIGLGIVLMFVGLKMLLAKVFPIPTPVSLGAIVVIVAGAIAASLAFGHRAEAPRPEKPGSPGPTVSDPGPPRSP